MVQPTPKERPLAATLPHTLSSQQVLDELNVDSLRGLASNTAAARQQQWGPNQVSSESGPSWPIILFEQIANAMVLVLIIGMAVSFGIKSYIEGGVVAFVILTNIVVGFMQQYSAEKTMSSLRSLASPTARVIRDSSEVIIPSIQLVPGDIVILKTGDIVPADLRLIEAMNCEADEAMLTGEAVPVPKNASIIFPADDEKTSEVGVGDRINLAYASSCITRGRATGVVVGTGMFTEIGAIAESLADSSKVRQPKVNKKGKVTTRARARAGALTVTDGVGNLLGVNKGSPLQRKLSQLAVLLFGIALVFAVVVAAANNFEGRKEVILYAVGTGLSMIPASLVVVLTITMAVGARSMVAQNVIVRRLDSLEALGAVTDVCSDKTGTLTQGKMVTRMAWLPSLGTYQVSETNAPFDPTLGSITFHPMPASDVVAATDNETEHTHQAGQPDRRPELVTETIPDLKQHASNTGPLTSLLNCAALCNIAHVFEERASNDDEKHSQGQLTGNWSATGDPTEIAIQVFSHRFSWGKPSLVSEADGWKEVYEYPFDSTVKRMAVVYQEPSAKQRHVFMKGAVEMVLDACSNIFVSGESGLEVEVLDEERKDWIIKNMEAIASKGLRCLALATKLWDETDVRDEDYEGSGDNPNEEETDENQPPRKAVERGLMFLGLVGIYDPPRPESAPSVAQFAKASIRTHMLTGDHPGTAAAIAKEVGIVPSNYKLLSKEAISSMIMTAAQFDKLSDDQIDALPELPLVIARCAPQTKVRMIEALHRRGMFAAMTGDGVNDSPSLKKADIGIAMGQSGSDVAKGASDIVLTDDNFASILSAVSSGRRTFDNTKRFVLHLLAENVSQALVLLVGLVFKDTTGLSIFPLSPVEILWIIMVTSSFPAMGLGMEPAAPDVMSRPPHDSKVGIFTLEVFIDMMVYGTVMGGLCLGAFSLVLYAFGDGQLGDGTCNETRDAICETVFRARATTFVCLTWFALLLAWQMISMRRSFFRMHPKSETPYTQWMRDVWANQVLFWSVIAGFITIFPTLYAPVINDYVFKHAPITWEWAIVFVSAIIFMAAVESWKLAKRVYFRRQDKRLGILRSETVDDQRYIVTV